MARNTCPWSSLLSLALCALPLEVMAQDLHLKCHDQLITDLAFSPDDSVLASSSDDHSIVLTDATNGVALARLTGHEQTIHDIAFSRDGRLLASASYDGKVKLWDVEARRLRFTLSGHKLILWGVAFCPDDRTLFSVAQGRELKAWSIADGSFLYNLPESHELQPCHPLAFSPDGKLFATGGVEEFPPGHTRDAVMIWSWPDRKVVSWVEPDEHVTLALAFSSDGKQLGIGGANGVRLLNVVTNTLSPPFETNGKRWWGSSLLWLKGDDVLLSGLGRGIHVWQLPTSKYVVRLDKEVEFPLAQSRDGRRLAYRLRDNSIKVVSIDAAIAERER